MEPDKGPTGNPPPPRCSKTDRTGGRLALNTRGWETLFNNKLCPATLPEARVTMSPIWYVQPRKTCMLNHRRDVLEPYLTRFGLYTVTDPSRSHFLGSPKCRADAWFAAYGRWNLPDHPPHQDLVDDPAVSHSYRRVFLPALSTFPSHQAAYESVAVVKSESVGLKPQEIAAGLEVSDRWIIYSTWEMKSPPKDGWEGEGKGVGRDLVLVHGEFLGRTS